MSESEPFLLNDVYRSGADAPSHVAQPEVDPSVVTAANAVQPESVLLPAGPEAVPEVPVWHRRPTSFQVADEPRAILSALCEALEQSQVEHTVNADKFEVRPFSPSSVGALLGGAAPEASGYFPGPRSGRVGVWDKSRPSASNQDFCHSFALNSCLSWFSRVW